MFDFTLPDLSWRSACLPKKSGGVRHIKIPNDDLKECQSNILQYLYQLFYDKKIQVSSFAHGFVPWRNCATSIMKHSIDSKVFLCMDMKDFFDNFPIAPVKQKLLEAGISEVLVDKILTACTCDGAFPQGSPVSPFLTNIGMLECDLMISAYAKRHGFTYTRYADDITLSLDPEQPVRRRYRKKKKPEDPDILDKNPYRDIFFGVEAILKSHLGLVLKHKKDHIIFRGSRSKPVILGICIRQDGAGYSADRKLRNNTRAAVFNLSKKIRSQRGVVQPEDFKKWAEILGTVQYLDYIRSFSPVEAAANADPVIQEKHWNYLCGKFKKAGQ